MRKHKAIALLKLNRESQLSESRHRKRRGQIVKDKIRVLREILKVKRFRKFKIRRMSNPPSMLLRKLERKY